MNRYKVARKVSILGLLGNIFLLIIKAIIAFITNSQAMLADALNSAGDIFSSCMTFIGNKIASKPRDKYHNLGYGKAEYIFSIMIALSMFYISVKVFLSSCYSLIHQENYHFSIWLIIVSLITIIVKASLYFYTKHKAKEINNLLILSNSIDHRNDCFLTSTTLLASILAYYNIYYFDSIIAIFITLWIMYSGIKIFISAYHVLMDRAIDEESINKVYEIIKKYPEVVKVNHFNSTPVGYQYQVNFTIFVDGDMSTYESHKIANQIEKDLMKVETISLAVIHVNPIKIKKTSHQSEKRKTLKNFNAINYNKNKN